MITIAPVPDCQTARLPDCQTARLPEHTASFTLEEKQVPLLPVSETQASFLKETMVKSERTEGRTRGLEE